jgi:putative transposase
MAFDPDKHHRRSIRLPKYDYSRLGAYFITICIQERVRLFGEVVGDEMRLNDAGRMVERWWLALSEKFPSVATDAYVVMPNHFHGVVMIVDIVPNATNDPNDVGATRRGRPRRDHNAHDENNANDAADAGNHVGCPYAAIPLPSMPPMRATRRGCPYAMISTTTTCT